MTRFLPGQHRIEGFGNGGFRFGGMSHQGSLLVLPSGMRALAAHALNEVSHADVDALLAERADIDFVLVGTGETMLPLPLSIVQPLRAAGLQVDGMSTSAAISAYNVVQHEGRRVAAVLIAVAAAGTRHG